MTNRNGDLVSAQVSVGGPVTFDGGNFRKDVPFCVKNDGEAAVVLEVNLWGMPEGEFITTRFETGWNPEIVREIKATSSKTALIWGY
ncbi:MAG: hypothetical protein HDS69_02365 [Bacteroidales bacterium]|nr:hypothetical protein [Bacteroidales bacterium]